MICSLNVRGLSNTMKRREIFRWLKLKSFAIYFLQEVHCTQEKENWWTSEWGFSAIFSSYSSASAGTCILFNNNFEFQILKQLSDPEGRFVIADIKTEGSAIRNDKEVHGITILGTECKISQYADDTTMILDGSQSSFSRTLYLFDAFGSISGLKVNYDKTESLWIGSFKNSNSILFSNKQITWAKVN